MVIEIRTNPPQPTKVSKVSGPEIETQDELDAISQLTAEEIASVRAQLLEAQRKIVSNSIPLADLIQKHQERLAYNAAYQRDLRTIKRLGLSVTVAEWREKNVDEKL